MGRFSDVLKANRIRWTHSKWDDYANGMICVETVLKNALRTLVTSTTNLPPFPLPLSQVRLAMWLSYRNVICRLESIQGTHRASMGKCVSRGKGEGRKRGRERGERGKDGQTAMLI